MNDIVYNLMTMSERRPGSTSPARQRWHPINSLAELGCIQEQLIATLDRPQVIDQLGGLALELSEVVQKLHPVTYNRDGIVSADELLASDLNSIPLVGNTKFTSHFKLAPTPMQFEAMGSKLAHEGYGEAVIRQLGSVLDNKSSSKKMETNYAGLAVCPSLATYVTLAQGGVLCAAGQPYIGMNLTHIQPLNIAVVAHEAAHALDYIKHPLLYVCDKEDLSAATLADFKSHLKLARELKAYAVGDCIEKYFSDTHGPMGHVELVSHKVEAIRQEVNGPVTSKDAFAAHDGLMRRLAEAGLGHICQ